MENESFVRQELLSFLKQHSSEDPAELIDEVVLSYLVSVLEDLGSPDSHDEALDVEEFTEIMEAYLPGFSKIKNISICEWMFELSAKLLERSKENGNCASQNGYEFVLSQPAPSSRRRCVSESTTQGTETGATAPVKKQSSLPSVVDEQVKLLLEMFPSSCTIEVSHCLTVAEGDTQRAAQILLHKQETGLVAGPTVQAPVHSSVKRSTLKDDMKVKEDILNKYSYIPVDEDKRTHHPPPVKKEPKKLVRYRDNKVVSTKGERFSEVKKEMSEETKKTYINLKPAKQYRFH